jgi:hypothetical protein
MNNRHVKRKTDHTWYDMMESTDERTWYQLIIDDPASLPGTSFSKLIRLILNKIHLRFLVLDYLHGAGIANLIDQEHSIIELNVVLNELDNVVQFDWADFFLFKNFPTHWDNLHKQPYPYVIKQTDTTIRAVDDQYIYIYTPCNEIVDQIKSNYEIESIRKAQLNELDYPE